ncbi:MAG: hypothetical protein WCT05_12630 [Lentisphaeria bacterium]
MSVMKNQLLTKGAAFRALLWLLAVTVFYFLLQRVTAAYGTHQAIAQSLLAGQNWGRQALVGSLEYPPLPTLLLLIFEGPLQILPLNGPRLLCALAQAFCLSRILILLQTFGRRWQLLILLLLPMFMVFFWQDVFLFNSADPGWLAAAVYVGFFCSLSRWQHHQNLRHLIAAAWWLGLLSFCGAGGILLALVSLPVTLREIRRNLFSETQFRGIPTIMILPFLYGIVLLLVWNWLVMGDALFFLRDFWTRAGYLQLTAFGDAAFTQLLFFYLLGILVLLISGFFSDQSLASRLLQPAFLILPLYFLFCKDLQVHAAATAALSGLTVLLLYLLFSYNNFHTRISEFLAGSGILAMTLCGFAAFAWTEIPYRDIPGKIPSQESLSSYIDQFWPDSRIMLYGLPLACSYPDLQEKRFVARLDYQEQVFLKLAADEQMHLLLPPPDGRYYPAQQTVFSDLYANGRPWLLLEKQWPGGWQLWRCVIPPEGESKLESLR